MADLNSINQADGALRAGIMPAAPASGKNLTAAALPRHNAQSRQSFASAMDNAGKGHPGAGKTPSAQPVAMSPDSSVSPMLMATQFSNQNRNVSQFEEILGDSMGLVNARAMAALSQIMGSNVDNSSDLARNVLSSGNVLATLAGQITPAESRGSLRRTITPPLGQGAAPARQINRNDMHKMVDKAVTGSLSARFESGDDGIAAIGYDRHGGTSYGKYQLSSQAGTMDQFVKFLRKESPALAKRLAAAGPANTGGRSGAMPTTWKKIAEENPVMFETLQERFIHESHYKPAIEAISQRTGLEPSKMSTALQEVLWSTAVQHGPSGAARIFSRAVEQVGKKNNLAPGSDEFDKHMIEKVYAMRSTQFGSSTQQVQNAVQSRLAVEKDLALAMLEV